ncbi:hypothetical protein BSKO_07013 [Bryopsis sp. KO-2023]|nr:hypothetical protein BSKO_07013 [Bryopsis sp. KO-2023]
MTDVEFAACHSNGGAVSVEQCKLRSAVSTSKGFAQLHCSAEFREWLATRRQGRRVWQVRKWERGLALAAIILASILGFYLGTARVTVAEDSAPFPQNVTTCPKSKTDYKVKHKSKEVSRAAPHELPTKGQFEVAVISAEQAMLADVQKSIAKLENEKKRLATENTDLRRARDGLVEQKDMLERQLEEAENGIWALVRIGGVVASVFCILLGLSMLLAIRRPFMRVERSPTPVKPTPSSASLCVESITPPVSESEQKLLKVITPAPSVSDVDEPTPAPSDADISDPVPSLSPSEHSIRSSSGSCNENDEENDITVLKDVTAELQGGNHTARDLDIIKKINSEGEREGESPVRDVENEVPSLTEDSDLEEIRCAGDVTSPIADRIRAVPRGLSRGPQLGELQRALRNSNESGVDTSEDTANEEPAHAETQVGLPCHPIRLSFSTTTTDPSTGPTPDIQSPTHGQAILRAFAAQTNENAAMNPSAEVFDL